MPRSRSKWRDWRRLREQRLSKPPKAAAQDRFVGYPRVWYPEPVSAKKPKSVKPPRPFRDPELPKFAPINAPKAVNVEKMIARALSSFVPEPDPTPALHLNADQLVRLAEWEGETRIVEDIDEIDRMLFEELGSPMRPYWRRLNLPLGEAAKERMKLREEVERATRLYPPSGRL